MKYKDEIIKELRQENENLRSLLLSMQKKLYPITNKQQDK
tara:strand:+ start:959 stop:1078 length:120 start_codon:yes stop_codon:yes gene_type:complete